MWLDRQETSKNKESLADQWDSEQKQKASVLPTLSVLQAATNIVSGYKRELALGNMSVCLQ